MKFPIEDYFINQAWICVNKIETEKLYSILDINQVEKINFEDGIEKLTDAVGEKTFLNFSIGDFQIIIGKFYFINHETLKNIIKALSTEDRKVWGFAIDPWSAFYSVIYGENNEVKAFLENNDHSVTKEGDQAIFMLKKIFHIEESQILALAELKTVTFNQVDTYLSFNKVELIKST